MAGEGPVWVGLLTRPPSCVSEALVAAHLAQNKPSHPPSIKLSVPYAYGKHWWPPISNGAAQVTPQASNRPVLVEFNLFINLLDVILQLANLAQLRFQIFSIGDADEI